MAWSFGDSGDLYAAPTDMVNGYWDSGALGSATLVAGRFAGSRAVQFSASNNIVKSSGVNDVAHHFVVSFQQTTAISGTTLGVYFELFDGATAQCSVVFRSDGAILLASGGPTGTILATYASAFTVSNTWYAFEFEIKIDNAAGSFLVRKNGNTVADFTATSLDTQNSANAYANKLQVGSQASGANVIDDLFWRSDASSVAWLGDIRCYARMPASDASVTFSRAPTSITQTVAGVASTSTYTSTQSAYAPFAAAYDGTVAAATVSFSSGFTGTLKCSVFSDAAGSPGAVLSSATTITNPVSGSNALTFSTPFTTVKGVTYWLGFAPSASAVFNVAAGITGKWSSVVGSSTFPVASPTIAAGAASVASSVTISIGTNYQLVNEAQQDALTSYVYDSNPGDADFYGVASIASTPATVIATTVRAYAQKSDAGTRTMAVQLKSPSGGGAPTIWNAADQVRATLTNANLTATLTSSAGIRAVLGKNTGKFYFEITATNWTGLTQACAGLALASVNLTGVFNAPANAIIAHSNNNMYSNSFGAGGSLGTIANGNVIAFAIDMTAQMAWIRLAPSGFWNGASGTVPDVGGGFSLAWAGSALLYPVVSAQDSGAVFTANFGGSAFVGAIPPGYTAGWLGASGTTVASPTLVLTTSGWQWAWRTDTVDPATGVAWTPAAVNNATIGPKVIA